MKEYPKRGDVFWINLDPTIGSETNKTRPCVVLSNNAQNKMSSRIIIAPITSVTTKVYPHETKVTVDGKEGKAMLDQLKTVDKKRLGKKISTLDIMTMLEINRTLKLVLSLT